MPAEGSLCESCPGKKEDYRLLLNVPATLCFYTGRREYDPIGRNDARVRPLGRAGLDFIGLTEDIQEELELESAFYDGIQCAKTFYEHRCNPSDEEWMDANDRHNPHANPRIWDIVFEEN